MTHSLCDMSHSHARPEVSATTWPVAVCSGGRWEADFRRGWKAGTEEPWAFPPTEATSEHGPIFSLDFISKYSVPPKKDCQYFSSKELSQKKVPNMKEKN